MRAFLLLLPLTAACASGTGDKTAQAQCERLSYDDPAVRAVYTGSNGDYVVEGPVRNDLLWLQRQAVLKCLQQRGLAPPGGVEMVRPQG